jgi:hypothetical protein
VFCHYRTRVVDCKVRIARSSQIQKCLIFSQLESHAKSHASQESVTEARENRNVFTYLSYWTLLTKLNGILGFLEIKSRHAYKYERQATQQGIHQKRE